MKVWIHLISYETRQKELGGFFRIRFHQSSFLLFFSFFFFVFLFPSLLFGLLSLLPLTSVFILRYTLFPASFNFRCSYVWSAPAGPLSKPAVLPWWSD